jgi:hypothetical protein
MVTQPRDSKPQNPSPLSPSALDIESLGSEAGRESRLRVYRDVIQALLTNYAEQSSTERIRCIAVFDLQRDHFQVLDLGWDEQGKRVFQPVIHIDIVNDKIWIQENITDVDLDTLFSAAGILPSEIVLGFHSPDLRELGIYAIE